MKVAYERIFCKNRWVVILIIFTFVSLKVQSTKQVEQYYPSQRLLATLVDQCTGMDKDQLDDWLLVLTEEYAEKDVDEFKRAKSELMSSISNVEKVKRLISFAQEREGTLPTILPANYIQLLDFYAKLKMPRIINELPLERYFFLQSGNIVPIFALSFALIYWSMYYESDIYKYVKVTKNGRVYTKAYSRIVLGMAFSLLTVNELFDLFWSGMILKPSLFSASIQSYHVFADSQINGNIFYLFVLMWISKYFGIWLIVIIGEAIASMSKNLKEATLVSLFMMMAILFLGEYLEKTALYSVLQIGYLDWKKVIETSQILLPFSVSSFVVGVAITVLIPTGYRIVKR